MNNIVHFGSGRSRPRRSVEVDENGARILFFTGVRYVRSAEDEAPAFVAEPERFCDIGLSSDPQRSEIAFELAGR